MHRQQNTALALRQQELLLRSAELRFTLADQAHTLRPALARGAQLWAGAQWLRRHPVWPLAALVLLMRRRPLRALSWATRLVGAWQLFVRARHWLDNRTAGKT